MKFQQATLQFAIDVLEMRQKQTMKLHLKD